MRVAEANDSYHRAKLAAALVKNNRIIAIGTNRMRTDPMQAKYGRNKDSIFLHAEIHAIKNALRTNSVEDIRDTVLYVCRVKRPDERSRSFVSGMAKPCEGCMRAVAEFGIKNVIYTTDEIGKYGVI